MHAFARRPWPRKRRNPQPPGSAAAVRELWARHRQSKYVQPCPSRDPNGICSVHRAAWPGGRQDARQCANTIMGYQRRFGEPMAPRNPGQTASPAAQAAKLRGILESAVTAIITIGDRGMIEDINPATERLF